MDDGPVDPARPRSFSAGDLEIDIERSSDRAKRWSEAGKEHVLKTAAEVASTGEAAEVSTKDLLTKANHTKVFAPGDVDDALLMAGVSIEQLGCGTGRSGWGALVPLRQAFVYADALDAVTVETTATRRVARLMKSIDRKRAAGGGVEDDVVEVLRELCSAPSFEGVRGHLGWSTADGGPLEFGTDGSTAPRRVAPHRIAGLASRDKMWVERDAVVRSISPHTGAPVLRVVEAKGQDPELFSTQQLGRGLHATLVDDDYAEDLAAGAAVETWQVHLADRSDHAHSLRIYHVEFAGDDTVFDRQVTGTFEVRFG